MTLTVKQLYKSFKNRPYVLLRFESGHLMGVNAKVAKLAYKRFNQKKSLLTKIVSYRECSFLQYINHKHPFIK
jgi:hypothetical protein